MAASENNAPEFFEEPEDERTTLLPRDYRPPAQATSPRNAVDDSTQVTPVLDINVDQATTLLRADADSLALSPEQATALVPPAPDDEQRTSIVAPVGAHHAPDDQATSLVPPPQYAPNLDDQATSLVPPPGDDQATSLVPGAFNPYVPPAAPHSAPPLQHAASPLQQHSAPPVHIQAASPATYPQSYQGSGYPGQQYDAQSPMAPAQIPHQFPPAAAPPPPHQPTGHQQPANQYLPEHAGPPAPQQPYPAMQPPVEQPGPPPAWPASMPGQLQMPPVPVGAIEVAVPGSAPPLPEAAPDAEDFAKRRAHRPSRPVPTMGIPALLRKVSFGLISPSLSKREEEFRDAIAKVRRNFGGLRQVTVVNPKGGAGKTVAVLMTAMTFGQSRGGYVLAWDNNETQGTLGMRAQQDFHTHTVRDVLTALDHFQGSGGKVGDLTQFVRSQGEAMFDVLASDESATAGEMLTAQAFADIREVVDRFYKLIIVDTGNNVRAENWQAAIDATDQLVVTMSARGDSAETASRMLDHLEQTGRADLARRAVTVISMPATRKGLDLPAIERHFTARTRAVLIAPYEPLLDSGEPIRYEGVSKSTREAWLRIGAAIAEGL